VALEKDFPLDLIEEDLTDKSDDLLNNNPVGKIPSLSLDDGRTFNDSTLICEYLDSLNDMQALIPRQSADRFKILNLAAIAHGMMDVTVTAFLEQLRPKDQAKLGVFKNAEEVVQRCAFYFERHIEQIYPLSLASISLACALGYIQFRHPHLSPDEAKHPQLHAWFEEFSQRPSMIETAPKE